MTDETFVSEKKRKLLDYKHKILEEINDVERQIKNAYTNTSRTNFIYDEDSSDSDTEILVPSDPGPSLGELNYQQSTLKLRLQATQELTGLQILQYEVNVLVEAPVLDNYTPETEEGVWKEVTVDCRIDLVPFLITFYVHQPKRVGSAAAYYGVQVSAVKQQQARELPALLTTLSAPSLALEMLLSYAVALRSRRGALAALAGRPRARLRVDLLPEGGYLVKFGDLFQMCWVLVNNWSPLAPFTHNMKFQFEYMEESLVRRVQQVHKALSDPTIDTEERTALLDQLISICLEAKGEDSETMTSDQESVNKSTLDKADKEMMAPPKSLPKKTKHKGKENEPQNKKRPNTDHDDSAKRSKLENGTAKRVNSNKDASVKSASNKNKSSNNDVDVAKDTCSNNISNINKDGKNAVNKNKNSIKKAVSNEETDINTNNKVSTKKQSTKEPKAVVEQDCNKDGPKNKDKMNNKNKVNNVPATDSNKNPTKELIKSSNETKNVGLENIKKKDAPKSKDKINKKTTENNKDFTKENNNKKLSKEQIICSNETNKVETENVKKIDSHIKKDKMEIIVNNNKELTKKLSKNNNVLKKVVTGKSKINNIDAAKVNTKIVPKINKDINLKQKLNVSNKTIKSVTGNVAEKNKQRMSYSKERKVINDKPQYKINKNNVNKNTDNLKARNTNVSNVGSTDSKAKPSRIPKTILPINRFKNTVRASPRQIQIKTKEMNMNKAKFMKKIETPSIKMF